MKNNDKKLNQICQDDMPDIIEIPLKKLHKNLDFIQSIDLEEVTVILTHKGKWEYSLMGEIQYTMLIDVPDPYENAYKDPRLEMLPPDITAVPLSVLLECMIGFGNGLIDLGSEHISKASYLMSYGGEKI